MKQFSKALTVMAMLLAAACNNAPEQAANSSTAATSDTAKSTAPPVDVKATFTPFDVLEINHTVKDYAKWKPAFDADSAARIASGLAFIAIGKNDARPNDLVVAFRVADLQKAKDFVADPRLKDVMEKNGVISKPAINYYHVIRNNPDAKGKQWVLVTHKVKDFDAWLKGFDAEGTATRATFGLTDVAVARGVDDPNLVHIVFDITDMAKAKARLSDPALKKIMEEAGVISAPTIEYYNRAE